ncbi:MAG: magnesium chelatase subunit D [Pseudomonadota bacterium]
MSQSSAQSVGLELWQAADLASALLMIDPLGLKGISVHAGAGPVRDLWLEQLYQRIGAAAPIIPVPAAVPEDRLLGGLDLAATLATGAPVAEQGLLERANTGILVARMAERLPRASAAHIAGAIDTGSVLVERQGMSRKAQTLFSLVLLDESSDPLMAPPDIVMERIAFHIELDGVSMGAANSAPIGIDLLTKARASLSKVSLADDMARSIDVAALQLGVGSLRALRFTLNASRALAALDGETNVLERHAQLACRLVLSSRITLLPDVQENVVDPPPPPSDNQADPDETASSDDKQNELADQLVEAAQLALDLRLSATTSKRRQRGFASGTAGGRSGALQNSRDRGRQTGTRIGDPRRDGRLDLLATLRAAAPWQKLRQKAADDERLHLRTEDFRLRRMRMRTPTIVIFVVDASGSLAMSRMAEAKGAVELLLNDCYTRRDQVALIAFRREGADLLLPPTRSLVRVRRSLAHLPGGGGTPLAAGMAEALKLALSEQSRGRAPFLVFLSDGKANISLSGEPGRDAADQDCHTLARQIRSAEFQSLFLDTSRRSSPKAIAIAAEMGAVYRLLPYADSATVSAIVGQLMPS